MFSMTCDGRLAPVMTLLTFRVLEAPSKRQLSQGAVGGYPAIGTTDPQDLLLHESGEELRIFVVDSTQARPVGYEGSHRKLQFDRRGFHAPALFRCEFARPERCAHHFVLNCIFDDRILPANDIQ